MSTPKIDRESCCLSYIKGINLLRTKRLHKMEFNLDKYGSVCCTNIVVKLKKIKLIYTHIKNICSFTNYRKIHKISGILVRLFLEKN